MDYRGIEEETVYWLNKARTNPHSLLPELKEMLGFFSDNQYKDPITNICVLTNEVHEQSLGQARRLRGDCVSKDCRRHAAVQDVQGTHAGRSGSLP